MTRSHRDLPTSLTTLARQWTGKHQARSPQSRWPRQAQHGAFAAARRRRDSYNGIHNHATSINAGRPTRLAECHGLTGR